MGWLSAAGDNAGSAVSWIDPYMMGCIIAALVLICTALFQWWKHNIKKS